MKHKLIVVSKLDHSFKLYSVFFLPGIRVMSAPGSSSLLPTRAIWRSSVTPGIADSWRHRAAAGSHRLASPTAASSSPSFKLIQFHCRTFSVFYSQGSIFFSNSFIVFHLVVVTPSSHFPFLCFYWACFPLEPAAGLQDLNKSLIFHCIKALKGPDPWNRLREENFI